jgi:hypothetical protein
MACKNQLKQGRLNFASEDPGPLKEHELRGPTTEVLARCAKVYADKGFGSRMTGGPGVLVNPAAAATQTPRFNMQATCKNVGHSEKVSVSCTYNQSAPQCRTASR